MKDQIQLIVDGIQFYYITSEAQNSSVTLRNNISRNSRWLWENFASYTKEIGKNITLQVYWDTQLKKERIHTIL
jgi:hypothetical protein